MALPTQTLCETAHVRWIRRLLITLVVLLVLLSGVVYAMTFHPGPTESEPVDCPADTPTLQPGQTVRVLSWNVQYMAGKDYVFFYDLLDESGPDERPSPQAYPVVPSLAEADGEDRADWFTHFPNAPAVTAPDRTIDFVFHSTVLAMGEHHVRQDDTLNISDHLPVVLDVTLPS